MKRVDNFKKKINESFEDELKDKLSDQYTSLKKGILELLDKKVVVVLMLASLRCRSLSRPGFSRSRKRRGDCRKLHRTRLML
jgi:hypothetical protein